MRHVLCELFGDELFFDERLKDRSAEEFGDQPLAPEGQLLLMPIVKQALRMANARLLLYQNLIQLGNQKFRQGQFSQATLYFSEAAKLKSEEPLPHLLIGSSHTSQGKFDLAETEFLKAFTLDPENSEACEKLEMVYLEKGDTGKARSYLERSLEIDPNQPGVRNLLQSIGESR
jgi:Flp pilus assembly protein TadD